MSQMFAKKAALIAIVIAVLLFVGGSFSGDHQLYGSMGTVIAGALIALAIAENNPRES